MRAGNFDRRITIQRKSPTRSSSGAMIDGWTTVSLRQSAAMMPVKGDERFINPQIVANEQVEFRVRYSAEVAALTPRDRLIYPALTEGQAADANYVIPTRSIYDVLVASEIERRRGLKILTNRRADAAT